MDPLATTSDLELLLGRSLTTEEETRCNGLLPIASAAVRKQSTQDFTQLSTTVRLKSRIGIYRLPQRPVTEITSVQDIDGNDVGYAWEGLEVIDATLTGALYTFERVVPVRNPPMTVDITYEHGYETIPDDIIGVVCQVVLRSLGQHPENSGIQQEAIAGYSYSIGSAAAAGAVGFLPAEIEILNRYRRVGNTAWTSP